MNGGAALVGRQGTMRTVLAVAPETVRLASGGGDGDPGR